MKPSALNISDLRRMAQRRLPRALFDFVDRGSEDDVALRHNREALERIKLRSRLPRDVSSRDTSVSLFGRKLAFPLVIGPTGIADTLWHGGELALADAAGKAGIPFTLATSSTTPIERVAKVATAGFWLQLYLWERRDLSFQVIDRAGAAGAEAVILTVDTPVLPKREFNQLNGMSNPIRPNLTLALDVARHPRWLFSVLLRYQLQGGLPRFANYPAEMGGTITQPLNRLSNSASVSWDDVRELRRRWPGTLILKGILNPEDARIAAEHGVDGLVVSNHGGRVLDCAPAPVDVLAAVIDAAGPAVTVLFDGGVRRGSDVVKGFALGARATMLGRSTLFGLAAGGEAGAARAIAILAEEISLTMAFIGARSIGDVDRDFIEKAASP